MSTLTSCKVCLNNHAVLRLCVQEEAISAPQERKPWYGYMKQIKRERREQQ